MRNLILLAVATTGLVAMSFTTAKADKVSKVASTEIKIAGKSDFAGARVRTKRNGQTTAVSRGRLVTVIFLKDDVESAEELEKINNVLSKY